ncbi:uncharacterized protein LOC131293924 [Anopheles ziemanni]|uniref:uncharacterized protein LOC131261934 n=1 Tax=Anopheles coustani TaxID=139045 RepID=UPI002657B0A6|nr:uncharacterized protein LOC131261934 [Anopheles coustani]XP_058177961.1 uncharacterized protein LOC131293924 [Anopheles ziemanni]
MFVDEGPSVESRVLSFEEFSSEYSPMSRDRYLRSSRYSPSYGNGNELQQDSGDWERYSSGSTPNYPRQELPKSRRKYGTYGKSSRTRGYSKSSMDVNGFGRKKTNRAARTYPNEGAPYGKTTSVTFKAVAPKPNCAQNLLIGCTPTVTRLPCSASLPFESYSAPPYYPHPPPMYHHAPPLAHYGPPHPAAYPGYYPPPPSYYPPPPPSPPQTKPTSPGAYPKPSEAGPSYKVAKEDEEEAVPGFAAPVQEELGESAKVPVISAFNKPSSEPSIGAAAPTAASTTARALVGTQAEPEKTTSTANPLPVLTTTTEANEDNDEFWAVESNTESSTDAAVEVATARR